MKNKTNRNTDVNMSLTSTQIIGRVLAAGRALIGVNQQQMLTLANVGKSSTYMSYVENGTVFSLDDVSRIKNALVKQGVEIDFADLEANGNVTIKCSFGKIREINFKAL